MLALGLRDTLSVAKDVPSPPIAAGVGWLWRKALVRLGVQYTVKNIVWCHYHHIILCAGWHNWYKLNDPVH